MHWMYDVLAIFVGIVLMLPTVIWCKRTYDASPFYGERLGLLRAIMQQVGEAITIIGNAWITLVCGCLFLFGLGITLGSVTSLLGIR